MMDSEANIGQWVQTKAFTQKNIDTNPSTMKRLCSKAKHCKYFSAIPTDVLTVKMCS